MSSFFTLPASQRKRKRTDDRPSKPRKRVGIDGDGNGNGNGNGNDAHRDADRPERGTIKQRRKRERDESISGSDSEAEVEPETPSDSEASSAEDENAADRRVRLAQNYLDNIRTEIDQDGFDAADLDNDLIAQRLREDVDEAKGRQFRLVASKLDFDGARHCAFRADTLSTTCVAVCQPYAYTVSKDRTLVKWKLQYPKRIPPPNATSTKKPFPGKRKPEQLAFIKGIKVDASSTAQHGHVGPVLAVAASPCGRFVATGGADNKLIIWSAQDLKPLKTFMNHRDSVLGLAFAPSTSSQQSYGAQLFSASADRSIKTFNLASEESLAYVETLFGHQDHVCAVSALSIDQCISVGSRDRSARLWKVVDETQLKFLGDSSRKEEYQAGSMDCVAALPPAHFVTGDDAGRISLWSMHKKKALYTVTAAHGVDEPEPLENITSESDPKVIAELKKVDGRREQARGITALAALQGTDVVLSGSWDGWLRVWRVAEDKRSIIALGVVGRDQEPESTEIVTTNGDEIPAVNGAVRSHERGPIRGVINSIAVFERRKELQDAFGGKKEGDTLGLGVVIGTGKETRLGRFAPPMVDKGRNGAMVFEVPMLPSS